MASFFLFYFMMKFLMLALFALTALFMGCSEPTDRIEHKLTPYLQEDLKFMVAENIRANGNKDALMEEPYYRIKDFRLFEGAASRIYAAYAEVDFFIYKDVAMHEKRKYRYDVHARQWDRYSKELKHGKDSIP